MSLSAHWELSQSVTDTRGTIHVILARVLAQVFRARMLLTKQASSELRVPRVCC